MFASGVANEVSSVLLAGRIFSSAMNSVSESFIKLSISSSLSLSTLSNKAVCLLLIFSSMLNFFF